MTNENGKKPILLTARVNAKHIRNKQNNMMPTMYQIDSSIYLGIRRQKE